MSTAITTYHSAMVTRIEALLTSANGWSRIPDPYDLPQNPDNFLRQGWGLKLGRGASSGPMAARFAVDRTFTIVICREVMKTDLDADGAASVALQLMEDLRSIIADFETNSTLNDGNGSTAYQEDSGIYYVEGEEKFMALEADFVVKVIESL